MKLVFFRGNTPTDRNPKEIMYSGLEGNDDVWENLASALGDERCDIVYTGGKREVQYSTTNRVVWVKDIKHYKPIADPDVVFCRGGFVEGDTLAGRFPNAIKIFYGAGKRYKPNGQVKYDIVLVDSQRQFDKVKSKGMNPVLWVKPASPCFRTMDVKKEFDLCYVADGRFPFRAKIKNVKWTYRSCPMDLKLLHLGWSGKYKPSQNISVKRVLRSQMPEEYSKCKIGIVPYSDYDSAPRVIPEMLACGLPVVCLDSVHTNDDVIRATKDTLWDTVRAILLTYEHGKKYSNENSVQKCAEYLRGVINEYASGSRR